MAGMKAYDEYINGGVTKDSQMSYIVKRKMIKGDGFWGQQKRQEVVERF